MTPNVAKNIRPYLALGIGILSLSLSAMFVRWADAPGPVSGFYRMATAALLLFPLFVFKQRHGGTLDRRYLIFPILGGIASGFDLGLWNTSLSYTTAANATIIGNAAPLWVALIGLFFFHEHTKRDFWLGLLLALSGASLIVGTDFLLHPKLGIGDLMAAVASLFYAIYYITTSQGRRGIEPITYTWLIACFAGLTLLGINLTLGFPLTGYSAQTWLIFISAGVISQTIGYFALSYALGHLPASVVSPTMIGQPVMTTLLAIPLLGEIPAPAQLIGGLLALTGIFLVNQAHAKQVKDAKSKSS
jgi:drug/metabolite transporter (DMT)-like permease